MVRLSINIALLFILFLGTHTLVAQSKHPLKFSETSFDFEKINESDGVVEHMFSLINTSNQGIRIAKVESTCGCTVTQWPKDTLRQQEEAKIIVKFNPENRPGSFQKEVSVKIVSDKGVEYTETLKIMGNVVPHFSDVNKQFPERRGSLAFTHRIFNFGRVTMSDKPIVKEFEIVNVQDSILIISDSVLMPDFLEVEFVPHVLMRGDKGKIKFTFHSNKYNGLGFVNHNFTFYTSEEGDDSMKSITIYANVEKAVGMMDSMNDKPISRLFIENKLIDIGSVLKGDTSVVSYKLKNTGNQDLKIDKIEPNCSCIKISEKTIIIQSGDFYDLKATFYSHDRVGNQNKTIVLYTNSPRNPIEKLHFVASVKE